jgi:4-hydroxyproline epimerase
MMQPDGLQRIQVIDSHTGGEPTRVVISGGPPLEGATVAEKRDDFRDRFDAYRSAIVNEPRGSDVLVGALLTEPSDPSCEVGVIFFNNAGTLGMCGHGTIGLMVTLAHMGRLQPGAHRIETPVGVVTAELHESGEVSVQNVPCYRHAKQVTVQVPGYGQIVGDVAWGGNWFFLVEEHGQALEIANVESLVNFTWEIRQALTAQGITGVDGAEIDHIELFAPSRKPGVQSKNFVLCPGKAYDRSPCGTGTSAKLACLYADGKLSEGEVWHQESIVGSVFADFVTVIDGLLIPTIRGTAHIISEATLLLDPEDPFCWGIR